MTRIVRIYEACVEPPGDVMFLPSALMMLLENGQSHIYSESSMHNFWRSACTRHTWAELADGIVIDGHHVRLVDITAEVEQLVPRPTWTIRRIMRAWYEQNPRQRFYLRRHIHRGS